MKKLIFLVIFLAGCIVPTPTPSACEKCNTCFSFEGMERTEFSQDENGYKSLYKYYDDQNNLKTIVFIADANRNRNLSISGYSLLYSTCEVEN